MKYDAFFILVCPHNPIVWHADASDNGKEALALLHDKYDMPPGNEAIRMVIPDGFRLEESRPPALDNSLVKRGALVRLSMRWFGDLITRKSQEGTKEVYG